jgi:hypothetical protein
LFVVNKIPDGTWVCLTCGWTADSEDATGQAQDHTRATTHPTMFQPRTTPQISGGAAAGASTPIAASAGI